VVDSCTNAREGTRWNYVDHYFTFVNSRYLYCIASLHCYSAFDKMGLEATSIPPTSISREEHTSLTSQTPQSFGDIPPILRFQDQVEITLTPSTAEASGSSVSYEGRLQGQFWVTEA
jgi:hypothetical protein